VSDRRKIVRSSLQDRAPFCDIPIGNIGQVRYPDWFMKLTDDDGRNTFRDRVLLEYTDLRPYSPGARRMSYVHQRVKVNIFTQVSTKPPTVFDKSAECLMCQYIILSSFFPELLGSNIVEFSPLMATSDDIVINEISIDSEWIKSKCYRCQLCNSYLPGRYKAEYHPLVVTFAEAGNTFPDRQSGPCYSDIAHAYEALLLKDVPADTIILGNGIVKNLLASAASAHAENMFSIDPEIEPSLDTYPYRMIIHDEKAWGKYEAYNLPALWLPAKRRKGLNRAQIELQEMLYGEKPEDYWSSSGSMVDFLSYIGWHTIDPKIIYEAENSRRLRYALACVANIRR
jgi:hypothetical protein